MVVEQRHEWLVDRPAEWAIKGQVRKTIGTMHNFQGKEADAVILVLERAIKPRSGAVGGRAPYILNVAATRGLGDQEYNGIRASPGHHGRPALCRRPERVTHRRRLRDEIRQRHLRAVQPSSEGVSGTQLG